MSALCPYPKMPASTDAWALATEAVRQTAKLRWVATEKIHGAHLCITLRGDAVAVGKRKRALAPDEPFFDYPRALGPHYAALRRLAALVRREHDAATVVVYGEIFGGEYPHPEVDAVPEVHAVQTGVYYAPDVQFMAFDVGLQAADGGVTLLPFGPAVAWLEQAGVPSVPVCGTGTLTEMLALPVRFESRVPALLDLPALADNWAEGLVIKPQDDAAAVTTDGRPLLLKRKQPAFEESSYHQAQRWPSPLRGGVRTGPLQKAETLVLDMINANRIDSAVSKIGRPTTAALRAEVVDEVVRDVRASLETEWGEVLVALHAEDQTLLWSVARDTVTAAVAKHTRPRWLDPNRFMVPLLLAFIRGRLPDAVGVSDEELLHRAAQAKLRMHKFKRKSGPPRVSTVLSLLEGLRPESLLDVGSGRGAFLWPLLDRFAALPVTAIDALPHRVRDIEAVHAGGFDRVRGMLADVEVLSMADDAFDVVTILEVLEHLEDPSAAAREVLRVAKRFVVASVPSQPDDNPEHIRLFTVESLTALFDDAGAYRIQVHHVRNHMIAVVRCPT